MKRPFAVIGITYLLSQAVAAYFGSSFALVGAIMAAVFTVLYALSVVKRNTVILAVAVTICAAMTVSFAYAKICIEPIIPVEGESVVVTGYIAEEPYEAYDRYYYVIKTESIDFDGVPQKTKIRLSSSIPLGAEYSDRFEGEICFTNISSENSYESHKRLLSKGITATAYLPRGNYCTITEGNGGLYEVAIKLRNMLKNTVKNLYPDETGDILIAMMTGDDNGVDNDTLSAFRDSGMAHVLAVSGLHMTLIASAITWILRRLLVNRKIVAIIVLAFSWLFAAVAGFPMSSVRSAIMITVMLIGVLADKLHTPLNSLGIAVFIICLFNPYAAMDAGLLMSFSSTFGLIAAAPEINRYFQRIVFKDEISIRSYILKSILSSFITAFTASIFILPASVLCFGKVSLLSPFVNLLLVSVAVLFLGLGMVSAVLGIFGNIGSFIAYPFMAVDWFIGKILIWCIELFADIPGSVLYTGDNTAVVVFGCILIAVLWALLFRKSKQRKHAFVISALCCCVIVFIWFCTSKILTDSQYIKIYNVGDSAMVLACDKKSALLLGAGGNDYDVTLAQYDMQNNGISEITALVLNDMSEIGASCADKVIDTMNPSHIFMPESGYYSDNAEYAAEKKNIEISNCLNKSIASGEVKIINKEDRTGAVWSLIECGDIKAVLCPPDSNGILCPFDEDFDAVIMNERIPSSVTVLYAKVYIVCADYKDGTNIVSQLMARGLKNVYCTGTNGNLELACREGRLYVGGENI